MMECVCTFLIQAGLPKFLWAEAAKFVIWVKNRTPTRVLGNATPHEQLTGQKPNLASLPEWGKWVWVHSNSGSKLDACTMEARWVGYDEDSTHAHQIYWSETHKVSVERNIRFIVDAVTISLPAPQSSAPAPQPPTPTQQQAPQPLPATDSGEEEVKVEEELDAPSNAPSLAQPVMPPLQPTRQPMHQSTRVRKPSAITQRITAAQRGRAVQMGDFPLILLKFRSPRRLQMKAWSGQAPMTTQNGPV